MKRGVAFKLFFTTVFLFGLILVIFLMGQTLFFKEFYFNHKIGKLEKNMELFSSSYLREAWGKAGATQNINRFSDQNNAQMAILDEQGRVKYSPSFDIMVETEDRDRIKILIDNLVYLDGFQQLELEKGAQIEVEGFFDDNFTQALSVIGIQKGNRTWRNTNINVVRSSINPLPVVGSPILEAAELPEIQLQPAGSSITIRSIEGNGRTTAVAATIGFSLKKVVGKIIELNIPTQVELLANYKKDLLWNAIDYWNWISKTKPEEARSEKISQMRYYSGLSTVGENMILIKPVHKEDNSLEYLFTVVSLQPVGEAVNAMQDYYIYGFLFALVLIAGMALIYSRMISRPLIQMNRAASKMAQLDFSEKCRVHSKDELGSLAANLNSLSENLNAALQELNTANQQLKQDIEKERSLEQSRKEFVSSVSHEFKTPLGIIRGFAEGLKDRVAEEKREHYLEVIVEEIGKMDELVLDLLDLARLESGTYKLNWECFCLVELTQEIQERVGKSIGEKNIQIQLDAPSFPLLVKGDERRVEQVITNILNNAIRHTPAGGRIFITMETWEGKVRVSIENEGNHIAEQDLVKIWDRFYRVEQSRGRKGGGTGLGLSIVKNVLELHGSDFGAMNTKKGVCFYFTLPADDTAK